MIVSVGEVVWDLFSDRRVLGGAPMNVAYHLQALGAEVEIVTRVGRDPLGRQTREALAGLNLPLAGVQEDADLATGQVLVTVDADNEPQFEIVAPAAWDNLSLAPALRLVAGQDFSLVFGTLAQRAAPSRGVIRALAAKAAFRFYDVNLRPPFTTPELVLASLAEADLVKMNERELFIVGGWLQIKKQDKKSIAQEIWTRYDLTALAVTAGSGGAWVVAEDGCFQAEAAPVKVIDTVGAGDAFFAALIHGYLRQRPWPEILDLANRRGGYVASRPGATPAMPEK
ncbi:carbohydrate kinase family protein [Thiovibrio sp. JS02]